ncbi:spore cortex biosynthesis protein YabQ [Virgibacillus byunsanensis]|uniref:Spore cortex biosynthesis protein YabQ n=1 Tax=Virgibacillus byunsanensis TaxID=570945 RepID=A0ABW3LP45_9BACI
MTLNDQFITMIVMVSGGIYLGMTLDTFRRVSVYWKGNIFLLYFMEICFWFTQTLVLFYVLFLVNAGELRLYVFLACLLGFATYQSLFASWYKQLLEHIINIIAAIYRFLEKMVQYLIIIPIKFIINLLLTCLLFIVHIINAIFFFVVKVIYIPIKWILGLLYRLLPENTKIFLKKIKGFYYKMKNIVKKYLKHMRR